MLQAFRTGRYLRPYAAVVLGFMVIVILEGAVVRATGSGAGCGNHWPLCNGEVLPHHPRLATIIEFTHRSLTGICSTLFIGLLAWVFFARPKGDATRRAVLWSAFFLFTEALLGAVLVKGGYVEHNASNARVLVQCIHFTNTMILVAMLTLTWWTLWPDREEAAAYRPMHGLTWLALSSTMIVGATGSVAALADTLFPSPSLRSALTTDLSATAPLLIRMRVLHPASAMVMFVCVAWLCWRLRSRAARITGGLLAVQFALGLLDVALLAPVWLQVAHLLVANLFWIALVTLSVALLGEHAKSRAPKPKLVLTV